jgi:hypothetical protein
MEGEQHMQTLPADITERLRLALTGEATNPLVLIGNFEVENRWAEGELGLPSVGVSGTRAIVNRMDEFGLLLGGAEDYVILKEPPDPDYIAYLVDLGLSLPTVLTVGAQDPTRVVTEDAVADPDLIARIAALGPRHAHLWPHGISELEEHLGHLTGLPLAGPAAATCKMVNSKIYSRLVADATGVRQAEGRVCVDVDAWELACDWARGRLHTGCPVVLKDAYGVSGKGLLVVRDTQRLGHVEKMIRRRADRTGTQQLALVVEEWLPKRTDLNYQFTIDRDGGVHFDFVREAVTVDGVHQGHRIPPQLSRGQRDEIRDTATALGRRLAADGYFGIVGVDALITTDDLLIPMIEINARNNMSTYQERLRQRFFNDDQAVLARQCSLRLSRRLGFDELRRRLSGLLIGRDQPTGVLVNNFATVNAAAPVDQDGDRRTVPHDPFDGRLYLIIVGGTRDQVAAIDRELVARLQLLD